MGAGCGVPFVVETGGPAIGWNVIGPFVVDTGGPSIGPFVVETGGLIIGEGIGDGIGGDIINGTGIDIHGGENGGANVGNGIVPGGVQTSGMSGEDGTAGVPSGIERYGEHPGYEPYDGTSVQFWVNDGGGRGGAGGNGGGNIDMSPPPFPPCSRIRIVASSFAGETWPAGVVDTGAD